MGLPCGGAVRIFVEAMDPDVVARLAAQHVVAVPADQRVLPVAAEQAVLPVAGVDPVVGPVAAQRVVAARALQRVAPVAAAMPARSCWMRSMTAVSSPKRRCTRMASAARSPAISTMRSRR